MMWLWGLMDLHMIQYVVVVAVGFRWCRVRHQLWSEAGQDQPDGERCAALEGAAGTGKP